MPDNDHPAPSPPDLRERAQALLVGREVAELPGDADSARILHELRVHQVELELQNEELRRAQLDLEASRQRWFELYDLAPVGYCTVSAGGIIEQVNLAAAEMLGAPRADLAKRRFSEFIEPDDQPGYYTFLAQLRGSGEPQTCELRMPGGQGQERWVQLSATAAAPDAQGTRALRIVLVDVSARRQAQAAQAALRLSEQANRSRNELLSRVGHEFRTPLNAILGFSHVMLRDEAATLASRSRQHLQHIRDAGDHLLKMVNDLIEVSRVASGGLALRIAAVDLLGVLRDGVRDVAAQAESAGIAVELEPHGPATASVLADPTRLRQVVQNLLTNAIKYNRPAGRVRVGVTRRGEHWRVHVADTGLGMTPQQQAALFQPFNRLGREQAGIEGTGLGLVIVRDLVQAMGGRLEVDSEAGAGSEFRVDLVAAEVAPVEAAEPSDGTELLTRADVSGRVLCVEDDRANRELVRSILERRPGIALEIVETGAACIAAARRAWPDLLLLDLRLPDMPGLDVLKVLKQADPHRPLRCLVVSAEATPADLSRSREAGVDLHLPKPIDVGRLLSAIDRLIGPVGALH